MGSSASGEGLERLFNTLSFSLPLDVFYDKLNKSDKDLDNYTDKCNKLCRKNNFFKSKRLCSIILRFLEGTNRTSDKKDSDYDDCILFNYWIYDGLSRKFNYNYNIKVYHEFAEIQRVWNELIQDASQITYFDKCKPDNSIVNQQDWKQRKELYDYCVNYELIQKQSKFFPINCEQFYAYIKSHAPLYKQFKARYSSENKNIWPEFYSKCEKYDPDIVLPDLSCYSNMQEKESAPAAEALSQEANPDLSPHGTLSSDGSQIRGDSSPPVTKAGNVLLGVVVTSMTSGALYKFTPLGNMLRNIFGWNNNMRNFNGGDNGLFDYASESFNPYSGEEHYIGYHPAEYFQLKTVKNIN